MLIKLIKLLTPNHYTLISNCCKVTPDYNEDDNIPRQPERDSLRQQQETKEQETEEERQLERPVSSGVEGGGGQTRPVHSVVQL